QDAAMKTPHFTESQIIAIVRQAETGVPISALCKEHGISSTMLEKWRAQYGDTTVRKKSRTAKELAGILYKPGRPAVSIEDMQVTAPDESEHSFKSLLGILEVKTNGAILTIEQINRAIKNKK